MKDWLILGLIFLVPILITAYASLIVASREDDAMERQAEKYEREDLNEMQ